MSVTVQRSTKSFSSLVNMTIKMDGVTLDRLAPGESMTFELPAQKKFIKIKAFFSKKEIQVSDGDIVDIVRNKRVRWFKIAAQFLLPIVFLFTAFGLIESLPLAIAFMISGLIIYFYIYYFVPDFNLHKASHDSSNQVTDTS